jgi:arabinose-5-phosphate isomerase
MALRDRLNKNFAESVKLIYLSKGRLVITGIGKSAIVANKLVATLNSTGTPAMFMHAADAIHGDLGMIRQEDIVLCISKSGNTPEIKVLVPLLKMAGNALIGMVGDLNSYLGQQADHVLDATVEKEACPNNLAPTSSTTAQMALGDALAVCLLECREFSSKDFAKYHPGGALGKKLYLRVSDVYPGNLVPEVKINAPLKEVIVEITAKRLGVTAVTDKGKLAGVITDGDLRRMLEKSSSLEKIKAGDIMNPKPRTIEKDAMAVDALAMMTASKVSQLIVTDHGRYVGVIHLHDLHKEGIIDIY